MNGGFDYAGMEALCKQMNAMYSGFRGWLEQFLLRQALVALTKTKENTPVDTGWLRNNWYVGEVRRVGDYLEVMIINEVEYASYVEYGHMTHGGGWVEGRFMCTLAVEEVRRQIPAKFNREFAVWVRSLGADAR